MATAPAPILELATLRTTVPRDEVLQLQQPAIASLFANAKGVRKLQWGFSIEDPSLLHWFVEWDSLADHEALWATPAYGPFVELIRKFAEPSLVHAPVTVTKAPVIEWCTVTVSAETDTKEWEKGLEAVKRALEGAEGYYGISTGWTVEMARTYQLLIGWESKEAHLNWKQKLSPEEAAKAMAMFRSGVDKVTLSHVKLEGEVTA